MYITGMAGPIDGRTFPCRNLDLVYFVDINDLSGGEAYVKFIFDYRAL